MTWTLAGTTTNTLTNYADLYKEVFTTYLSTREGWSVTQGASNESVYHLNYTFQNTFSNEQHTFYMLWNGSRYLYRNNYTYTTTPGDNEASNSFAQNLYNVNVNEGEVYRVWYSTENNRTMMVTYGKRILMFCPGPSEAFVLSKGQANWVAGQPEQAEYQPFKVKHSLSQSDQRDRRG